MTADAKSSKWWPCAHDHWLFKPISINGLRQSVEHYYYAKLQVIAVREFRFIVLTFIPTRHTHTHTHTHTFNIITYIVTRRNKVRTTWTACSTLVLISSSAAPVKISKYDCCKQAVYCCMVVSQEMKAVLNALCSMIVNHFNTTDAQKSYVAVGL